MTSSTSRSPPHPFAGREIGRNGRAEATRAKVRVHLMMEAIIVQLSRHLLVNRVCYARYGIKRILQSSLRLNDQGALEVMKSSLSSLYTASVAG